MTPEERIEQLEADLRRERERVTATEQRAKAMEHALRRAYEFQLRSKSERTSA